MTREPKPWVAPLQTRTNLDWANLRILDFAKFTQPGGKEQLAKELDTAAREDGFWAVINAGITQDDIDETYSYAQHFFEDYSEEEKRQVEVDFASGNYFGYKVRGNKNVFGTAVRDNFETLNIAKFTKQDDFKQYHDNPFIQAHKDRLQNISRNTFEVAKKIFRLLAIILEIDEDFFVNQHLYDDPSDDSLRFTRYHPRSREDDEKVERTWARAHTDFGTLTLLFNQIVAGLQIRHQDQWKYVRSVPGGIICNVGDTLNFWSGGYFKSTVHRVIRPPEDQIEFPRVATFYFVRPGDNSRILIVDSPFLRKLGVYKKVDSIVGTDYVRKRVKDYHDKVGYDKQVDVKFKVGDFVITDGFQ